MRFFFGLILGALITIGAAYIHDAAVSSSMTGPDDVQARMVNWDVVDRGFARMIVTARDGFDRLIGRSPRPGQGDGRA